jgi:hypothetical protein
MGNSNKYADGLSYLLFPGNIGLGTCGYNFPESTAQDDGGGAGGNLSLSFSGSLIPFNTDPLAAQQALRGPSGYFGRYTVMATITGGPIQDWLAGPVFRANFYGAPNLRTIYGVHTNMNVENGNQRQDDGTFITERFKNGRAINSISQVNILDLISEGPIEGFISGIYVYNASGKTTGDIGYNSVNFQPFEQTYSNPETRSIFWDDVPVTDLAGFYNFQYANYKFTYGEKTNDHTIYNPYINLYEERRDYGARVVDKNKYPIQTSVTKSYGDTLYGFYLISGNNQILTPKTYYVYNTDISALKINVKINSLYEQILTGTNAGDVEKQLLTLRFIIRRILSNGELVTLDTSKYYPFISDYYSRDDIAIQGKISNSPTMITYEITLRPYSETSPWFELFPNQIGWAMDIVKMTREGAGGGLSNSTSIDSITEVYSDRFVYPDTAMVLSKFDARYFNNIPTRTYEVKLLKVKIPVNYNPILRTYTGPWNGKFKVAWTDNPAWCFYDLITNNRFGLGKFIDAGLTDKWTLYEIAQYCDQFVSDGVGGLEPRFRCNLYMANKEEAYKVLNDMASVFRAIVYYSAGQITLSQDSLKEPIYLFNNSNVIEGSFNYSDASKKSRKTVASVRYNDQNDNYKPAIEYIEDKTSILKYGIRETEIVAFGCTSQNQARRVGKWLLTTQNTETELVDFQVGLEGNYVKPGDVILIYDQYRRNQSYAGRTMELTAGYAVLDTPYNFTNTNAITGANTNNSFVFNVLTPTYNLNFGTQLGDLYATGFSDITSSGVTGLNSSFFRRSQLQSITINNPQKYLTSGSGIYSNNIRINFPSVNSIPENITPVTMSVAGNTFTKLAADGWPPTNDAQAYSSVGYSKNMFAEATANATNKYVMFALNSDQTADASYSSLDYAWYFNADGTTSIYEDGNYMGAYGTYNTSTKLRINYDGSWITYLKDNVIMKATPAKSLNQTLYFDSAFYSNGASINANYGTFPLNNYLTTLPQNTIWNIDINTSGYATAGINTRSQINNPTNTLYPGYYLESYLNKPKKYRILNITEKEPSLFNINALEYNDQKYANIDNVATLVNVPVRPALPVAPTLFLSGIFRNSSNSYCATDPCNGTIYTTNQGGINSVMYNIIPPANSSPNALYYVYVKPFSNFVSATQTPEAYLNNVISPNNLNTSTTSNNWLLGTIPPFLTPTGAGDYFFRVFAANSFGERSTPATGVYNLTAQASVFSVIASGHNIY